MAKVTVILLNWNGWKDTIVCLESLMRSTYTDYEVVVCDNASTDDSLTHIKNWADGLLSPGENLHEKLQGLISPVLEKPLTYLELDRNTAENGSAFTPQGVRLVFIPTGANAGYAGGNNVGIRYALRQKAEYIWLLNNDTLVPAGTLGNLVHMLDREPRLGLVGSVIHLAAQPERWQTYGGGRLTPLAGTDRFVLTPGPIDYVSGTSLFIRRSVIEQIGLLDEGFFFYWEDTDFSTRAKKKGWLIDTAANAIVYHKFSASVGGQSLKSDLFKIAAFTRYFKKHKRFSWYFPVAINVLGMVCKRLWRRQFTRIVPILKETLASIRRRITNEY